LLVYFYDSMRYGICNLSAVPLRKAPDDTSEMVSQLLFGETVDILLKKKQWIKVCTHFDEYEGWMDSKQCTALNKTDVERLQNGSAAYAFELAKSAVSSTRHVPLLMGSTLPGFDGLHFKINREIFVYNGQAIEPGSLRNNKEKLLEKVALKYLNAPYLWGGRSPFGIDCSGFTQMVFKLMGLKLKRDAYQQAAQGKTINMVGEGQCGDLAFFINDKDRIHHVGILLPGQQIIHASGCVRIDKLDQYGIFNTDTKKYSHRLQVIRRLL